MNKRVRVYVGCGLARASMGFPAEVERFKERLKEICTHESAHKCDFMIAFCDNERTALGCEMAMQLGIRQKPLLAMAHEDARVVDPIGSEHIGYTFFRYKDLNGDAFEKAREIIFEISGILHRQGALFGDTETDAEPARLAVA